MLSPTVASSAHFIFLLCVLGSYTGHVDALVRGLSCDVSESHVVEDLFTAVAELDSERSTHQLRVLGGL